MLLRMALDPLHRPPPGSAEELARFADLQRRLAPLLARVMRDTREPRTVLVNPSLSLDSDVIQNIAGLPHYEERLLCMLLLLKLPRTRVVYITSTPVDPAIVDYYLHLLPGVPGIHARKRLSMLSCHDGSTRQSLTEKLLARPRLLERLRSAIGDPKQAHMTCFNATAAERTLSVRLDIPVFANDPALEHLGSKSGARRVFRSTGVLMPDGYESLRDMTDVADALVGLRRGDPELSRAAVKLEYGTSGEGNALFDFRGAPAGPALNAWVTAALPKRLRFEEPTMDWERYAAKFGDMGGIVEAWIDGEAKRSPSVQCRIMPFGELEVVSTHEQVLGGPSGQVFLGSVFPAKDEYRLDIQRSGRRIAEALKDQGALGRVGVDFVTVPTAGGWKNYAIEINLRKGGTTHTYRILQFLTDGAYDEETGLYFTSTGQTRFYQASDNLKHEAFKRLIPEDLMDIAVERNLHFSAASQQGVFFHLIGALSGYGKLGLVCVADTRENAARLYGETVDILTREAQRS